MQFTKSTELKHCTFTMKSDEYKIIVDSLSIGIKIVSYYSLNLH